MEATDDASPPVKMSGVRKSVPPKGGSLGDATGTKLDASASQGSAATSSAGAASETLASSGDASGGPSVAASAELLSGSPSRASALGVSALVELPAPQAQLTIRAITNIHRIRAPPRVEPLR